MILNGSVLGTSVFLPIIRTSLSPWNTVRINGSGTFANVHVLNYEMTDAEIANLSITESPLFDGNTLMLARFINTLDAGSITDVGAPITSVDIYRKQIGNTTFDKLTTKPVGDFSYVDNTAKANVSYIYEVIGFNTSERTQPILSDQVDSTYYNHILSNLTGTVNYIFDLNLEDDGFNTEYAHQRYDGYSKYSQHSFGDRDFVTGSIKAIVNNQITIDGIDQTVDFLKGLRTFINNGEEKLLKTRKGDILRVVSFGYQATQLNVNISAQPYEISFQFEEVGDV